MDIANYIKLTIAATLFAAIEFYRYELPVPLDDEAYKYYATYFQTLNALSHIILCAVVIVLCKRTVVRILMTIGIAVNGIAIWKNKNNLGSEHHPSDWILVAIVFALAVAIIFVNFKKRKQATLMKDELEKDSMDNATASP